MPGGKTRVNQSWGLKQDGNNDKIESWFKSGSTPYFGYCKLCEKEESVENWLGTVASSCQNQLAQISLEYSYEPCSIEVGCQRTRLILRFSRTMHIGHN